MSGYVVNFNWMEEFKNNFNNWENLTESLVRSKCNHKTQEGTGDNTNIDYSGWCEECEVYEDSFNPMMNYGYILEIEPSKENIIKCFEETGLNVMYKNDTDEHFLVLTGGGMDLSQQIARAYIITQKWIPEDLITNVSSQKGLNVGGEKFEELKKEIISQLQKYKGRFENKIKEWEER